MGGGKFWVASRHLSIIRGRIQDFCKNSKTLNPDDEEHQWYDQDDKAGLTPIPKPTVTYNLNRNFGIFSWPSNA